MVLLSESMPENWMLVRNTRNDSDTGEWVFDGFNRITVVGYFAAANCRQRRQTASCSMSVGVLTGVIEELGANTRLMHPAQNQLLLMPAW